MSKYLPQQDPEIHEKWEEIEHIQWKRLFPDDLAFVGAPAQSSQWSRLPNRQTAARNRYPMAEPFALNRVHLKTADGANDYIIASPIQVGVKRYIATQGPKRSTVNHFYRMLASEAQSRAIIIMLGRTHENGVEQCFPYFPQTESESPMAVPVDEELHDGIQGSVILEKHTSDSSNLSQIRHLTLQMTWDGVTFTELRIVHILFEAWPNHCAPEGESRKALVNLIRTQSLNASPQNPIIVHCSAGCGRTGTFIALDCLISSIDAGELDNLSPSHDPVAQIVGDLRKQRMAMVQKESQFRFLYHVLLEELESRHQQRAT